LKCIPRGAEVIRLLQSEDNHLIEDILKYLAQFSSLPDGANLIIAVFVLSTYLQDHKDIYYLPEILFHAVPERGKTRTGKAAVHICYRGVHTVDSREANLFRFSQDLHATILLDIRDLWKKVERTRVMTSCYFGMKKGRRLPEFYIQRRAVQ